MQLILSSIPAFEEIVPSSDECRTRSRDFATPYNQYVKRAMPTIISTRLNMADRNVNSIAPNTSIAIPKERIQRSEGEALEFMSRSPLLLSLLLVPLAVGSLSPSASKL